MRNPEPPALPDPKPAHFVGPAKREFRALPKRVRESFGHAVFLAQSGEKAVYARPLKGFGGAGVVEIVEDYDTDTYRAIYTVRFAGMVYVLCALQKKSKRGVQTPREVTELIRERLADAEEDYRIRSSGEEGGVGR